MNYIGKRLKEERKKANLTSKEFANMVGVSPWYITQIESDKKNPSLKTFIKFVNILNISADVLIKDITSTGKTYLENDINEELKDLNSRELNLISQIIDIIKKNKI
ncbi:TPA: helix-turn-helix transcriptional regulator [Clostridioides difficile]|nr:helix-turn-helix transcriptional regulator [Clostridioides difficile]HBF0008379.1 helix-turn-helix transcriptional regulator [Clostridioides difficile]HEK5098172.1 helix-turn-helix transcriptional regulator [Clostridioides difficile]HEK8809348.1 helix-turn-helix transcriptional regulator [Clostridioides difficile]HEK8812408.1 helix-turn-helix transcriptional regulator [Clostridioides difficile]